MAKKRKFKVLVLCHEALVPPDDISSLDDAQRQDMKSMIDVRRALQSLGHQVRMLGVNDELAPIRKAIDEWEPHVVFNLLEEFQEQVKYDAYVASYLELKRCAYTGCNPRGLFLARDKALSKKILSYHRIRVPRFAVFPRGRRTVRRPKDLEFPLIVKSLVAEASEGISQASVVHSDEALEQRVRFVHKNVGTDAVAEQFIAGRELYVGVMGTTRLKVLPTWELVLDNLPESAPRIATEKVKWDQDYCEKHKIELARAKNLDADFEARVAKLARRICKALHIDGYGRIDFRLSESGHLYFLECNPNPAIGANEEFASAAQHTGVKYELLIQRLLEQAIRRAR